MRKGVFTKAIILLAAITLIGCNNENIIHINDNLIVSIAKEDQRYPSQNGMMNLFVKCEDDKIALLNVEYLREIYRLGDFKSDFETFLSNVLNQKQKISSNNIEKKFEPDYNILDQYNKLGLKEIINSYCSKSDDRYYLNNEITENKTYTILYLLFLNNYMSVSDDYIGKFVIWKFK
jgi:hypothetical protein